MRSPPLFIVLGILVSFPALADPCQIADSLDPDHEIEASPRSDFSAEYLALLHSEGLAADSALYLIIHSDLEAIRDEYPELAEGRLPIYTGNYNHLPSLHTRVRIEWDSHESRQRARNGDVPTYDCLVNEVLGGNIYDGPEIDQESERPRGPTRYDTIWLEGVFNPHLVADFLQTIPEIHRIRPPFFDEFRTGGDSACFYSPDGINRVYLLAFQETLRAPFPVLILKDWARFEFDGAGHVVSVETSSGQTPHFQPELQGCLDRELGVPLAAAARDIPVGPRALLLLVALTSLIGLRLLR